MAVANFAIRNVIARFCVFLAGLVSLRSPKSRLLLLSEGQQQSEFVAVQVRAASLT